MEGSGSGLSCDVCGNLPGGNVEIHEDLSNYTQFPKRNFDSGPPDTKLEC